MFHDDISINVFVITLYTDHFLKVQEEKIKMKKNVQIIFRVTENEKTIIFDLAKKTRATDGRPMNVSAYIRSIIFGAKQKK